jgi:hypothetical protein
MTLAVPDVRIGDPLRHEALSVFPLFAETNGGVDYLLSDEALEAKSLVVEEVSESGSVPDLLVENKGDTRVLFIEGEELVGAKQNRILNTSLLVAAHTKIKIPVSCVEQGRWGYKTRRFGSSGSHSPSKLRYALKSSVTLSAKSKRGHRSDQGKVWEEVERQQLAMGASSESAAMSDTFDTYQDQLAVYREKIKYVEGATGVAVAIGKKVVALDLFDKPSTCEKVWGRLLSGLVMDALEEGVSSGGAAEVGDVERLLADTGKAEWEQVDAAGEGEEFRSEFKDDHASALTFDDNLVHGSVVAAV